MTRCVYGCDGGWVPVTEEYVQRQSRRDLPAHADPEARADHEIALRNSVYPCPACRPEQYELWRGGHFAPDHTCDECRARRGKRRPAGKPAAAAANPERSYEPEPSW